MPLRAAQFPRIQGITAYRRLDYGRLLRVHALDTRSFRSMPMCEGRRTESCSATQAPDRTMLGFEQERWLADGLGSGAYWNLLAQQKLFMPLDGRAPGAAQPSHSMDNWDGFAGTRQRLLDTIARRKLTNVVIASGDAHVNMIGSVPRHAERPDSPAIATEFLATSISSGGDGHFNPRPELTANNPFLALFNAKRGYHLHDITPEAWHTDVRIVDQIQKPGGTVSTFARFVVDPRKPGPQKA
jgi:alkaline phosphatase D